MSLAQVMRDDLRDIHSQGSLVDASGLAMLAIAASTPNLPVPELSAKVREYRPLAVTVLKEFGYCECGIKLETPRCPSCSRLHDASG